MQRLQSSDRIALAEKIVRGVWSTFSTPVPIPAYHKTPTTPTTAPDLGKNLFVTNKENNDDGLHLISQFFHAPSCLHNEGVWHNCLMGINYVLLSQKCQTHQEEYSEKYKKLSDSLYELNFDEKAYLFRNRTHSTHWNHETSHCTFISYQYSRSVVHYKEDPEKNLNSNAIAILFWSFLPDG
jgi:hypothetical protein